MSEPQKTEDVIAQASAAALFFRRLIDEGVPVQAAISMAGQYVVGQVMTERLHEKPSEPWEEPEV